MSNGGSVTLDIRLVLASASFVIAVLVLVAALVRDLRTGEGVRRSSRMMAFLMGVVLVCSVAVIGLALLG